MTPLIAGLITAGMKIIEKVVPDPAAAKEAQFKLMELAQKGELAQLEADVIPGHDEKCHAFCRSDG